MNAAQTAIACRCGKVALRAQGSPMGTAVCYCDDCQQAARQIEAGGDGPPVADPDGGTGLSLWRSDRVAHLTGEDHLTEHRLTPDTATKRMVASCCNSAMYIAFDKGPFWYSVMRNRIAEPRPAIEMRLMTKYRDSSLPFPDDAPTYTTFPKLFVGRLMWEWVKKLAGR